MIFDLKQFQGGGLTASAFYSVHFFDEAIGTPASNFFLSLFSPSNEQAPKHACIDLAVQAFSPVAAAVHDEEMRT